MNLTLTKRLDYCDICLMLAMIKEAFSSSGAAAASSSQPLKMNGTAIRRISSQDELMGQGTSIFWSCPVDATCTTVAHHQEAPNCRGDAPVKMSLINKQPDLVDAFGTRQLCYLEVPQSRHAASSGFICIYKY